MNEVWKPVVGYEGLYEVSDHGRVRRHGKVLRTALTAGYPSVNLRKNNASRTSYVHELVLCAFVGPRPEGFFCCHGPLGCLNNHVSNLRWGTPADNAADRKRDGTENTGSRNGMAKLDEPKVREILLLIDAGLHDKDVAAAYNVHYMQVSRIRRGKTWRHLTNTCAKTSHQLPSGVVEPDR